LEEIYRETVYADKIDTIDVLKARLKIIEKAIEKANQEHSVLLASNWGILKQNIEYATKENRNLLNELSEKYFLK